MTQENSETEGNPFKDDALNRINCACSLTHVVETSRNSFVLAIDSEFGTGKTTFITMWKRHLELSGFRTILFNAWESDFTENALISMLGEFRIASKRWDPTSSAATQKIEAMFSALAKQAVPITIKAMTMGFLDGSKMADDFGKATEGFASEQIKEYEKHKTTVTQFKKELAAFVETFGGGKPVVFFVDELDRCRPLFAVEVLEHAKHLFAAPGVVFVLALHKTQLTHSIQALYGNLDADGYLRRFIDLEFRFPPAKMSAFIRVRTSHYEIESLLGDRNSRGLDAIHTLLGTYADFFSPSLRALDQLICQLNIVLRLGAGRIPSYIATFLLCLRSFNPKEYYGYVRDAELPDAFLKRLDKQGEGKEHAAWLRVGMETMHLSRTEYEAWHETERKKWRGVQEESDDSADLAAKRQNWAGEWDRDNRNFKEVVEVLDMAAQFRLPNSR